MLDVLTLRVLSAVLAVANVLGFVLFARGGDRAPSPGEVRASRPVPTPLNLAWLVLGILPLVFYVLGAAVPSAVYGTLLNLAFPGGTYVQWAGVGLLVVGSGLAFWSARSLGRFMVIQIQVRSDHELVRQGPYSRVRHPAYTSFLLLSLGATLLFLHAALILGFLAYFSIAEFRARREEQLLGSSEGFGEQYRVYMSRTGRFLPGIGKG